MNTQGWTSYQEQQPTEAGPYWWRLRSNALPDLTINFVSHMRIRGTRRDNILSPSFDHWAGWEVQVPTCEWRIYEGYPTNKIEYEHLSIEGLTFGPCPFCGKVPTLKACQACSDGGFIIGPSPQNYNLWKLQCCAWGSSPNMKDPRQIEQTRQDAFLRMASIHVNPLEDALAASKERELGLVEALYECVDVMETTDDANMQKAIIEALRQARAALASVKDVQDADR